jgi:hypothetical protein
LQQEAEKRHQEVMDLIEALPDTSGPDTASSVCNLHYLYSILTNWEQINRVYSGFHMRYFLPLVSEHNDSLSFQSSNSITMLPSEPKIFHGRELEMAQILTLFHGKTPRIAILGPGGIGKTSLARAVVHHTEVVAKYEQHRFFVACASASTNIELAAIIGAHLGLQPGKDLTGPVIQYLTNSPPSLLILDNLETLWEPIELRGEIEEFLSLLTDVAHLALMVSLNCFNLSCLSNDKLDYNAWRKTCQSTLDSSILTAFDSIATRCCEADIY